MANNKVSRILNKLAALNDPRIVKLVARAERISAAEQQKQQRANAERRRLEDKAAFLIGARFMKLADANDPDALAVAAIIAGSPWQEYDAKKLDQAISVGVLSSAFKPRNFAPPHDDGHDGGATSPLATIKL